MRGSTKRTIGRTLIGAVILAPSATAIGAYEIAKQPDSPITQQDKPQQPGEGSQNPTKKENGCTSIPQENKIVCANPDGNPKTITVDIKKEGGALIFSTGYARGHFMGMDQGHATGTIDTPDAQCKVTIEMNPTPAELYRGTLACNRPSTSALGLRQQNRQHTELALLSTGRERPLTPSFANQNYRK